MVGISSYEKAIAPVKCDRSSRVTNNQQPTIVIMPQVQQDILSVQLKQYGKHRLNNEQNLTLCRVVKAGMIAAISLQTDPQNIELLQSVERGDLARKRVIRGNIGLCVTAAKKYGRGMELPDAIQQGTLGLNRALDTFDPSRGYQFSTYAYPWVRQSITRERQLHGRPVAVPVYIYELVGKIKTAQSVLSSKLNRRPTQGEVAERLGIPVARINHALRQVADIFSLDVSASNGKGGLIDASFLDAIASPGSSHLETMEHLETLNALQTGIRLLEPRDREIVTLKYGLGDGEQMTSRAIAVRLGIKDKDVSVRLRFVKKQILERHLNAMIPIGIKIAEAAIDTFRAKIQIVAVLEFKGCMDIGRLKTTFNAWSEDDIKEVLAALEDEGKVRSHLVMHDDVGKRSRNGIRTWEAVK